MAIGNRSHLIVTMALLALLFSVVLPAAAGICPVIVVLLGVWGLLTLLVQGVPSVGQLFAVVGVVLSAFLITVMVAAASVIRAIR